MKNIKCGFTLVEMIISITIFMIFIGIVGGSYVSLVSANRSANEMQKLYRQVRHMFDTVASAVREGAIDYGCIDPALSLRDARCIEDSARAVKKTLSVTFDKGKRRKLFSFKQSGLFVAEERRDSIADTWKIISEYQPLTQLKIPMQDAHFSIFPEKNPYDSGNVNENAVQYQPSVTVSLKIAGNTLRTTYSSRTYGTRTLYE